MVAAIPALSCSVAVKSCSMDKQLIPNPIRSHNLNFVRMRQGLLTSTKLARGRLIPIFGFLSCNSSYFGGQYVIFCRV